MFDVAVFTNLSQDHLDFHGTIEDYFAAKASLFTPQRARAALVDVDDACGRRLAAQSPVPVTTCSRHGDASADWRAQDVRTGPDGSTFTVLGPPGSGCPRRCGCRARSTSRTRLCAVVALALGGVPLPVAAAGVRRPRGRARADGAGPTPGQPYLALVDYAHTPDAVTTLLDAVRRLVPGRVLAGARVRRRPRPVQAPARWGRPPSAVRDLAVLTDDNPRSEDPAAILAAMAAGAYEAAGAGTVDRVVVEPDRAAAIGRAVRVARAGDAVVVAGKGHETGQEVAGVVRPFDDRVELRRAIERTAVAS